MTKLTQFAKRSIQASFLRFGIIVVRSTNYGILPWNDVQRLSRELDKGISVCFDVGANVGRISLSLLDQFRLAKVYSFEPHPTTFAKLRARIKSERFFPHELALGDTESNQKFYVYDEADINSLTPSSRFTETFHRKKSEMIVRSTTIDKFCVENEIEAIDLLKIDAEGCDLCVLKGAERMLHGGRIGFVYTEFNDCLEKPGVTGGSLNQISEYLARFNFHFIATYTDRVFFDGEFFPVANLLMVRGD